VNLPFIHGSDSWELSIPAVFLLDENGLVIFNRANADYTDRPEPTDIIDFLSRTST